MQYHGQAVPSPEEIHEESAWITQKLIIHLTLDNKKTQEIKEEVRQVLIMLKEEHLEIPYIYTHRKELDSIDILQTKDFWEIYKLDNEWVKFYKRKCHIIKLIKKRLRKNKNFSYLKEYAMNAHSTIDLEDLQCFISHANAINEGPKLTNETINSPIKDFSVKQQSVAKSIFLGMEDFTSRFKISPAYFDENLQGNALKHPPPQVKIRILKLAGEFLRPPFLKEEYSVTMEATKFLAEEIAATQPYLRQKLRQFIMENGEISTSPTEKGMQELHVFHPAYRVKRISKRPIKTFTDDIWLEIKQKEQEGLIKVSMGVDPNLFKEKFKINS